MNVSSCKYFIEITNCVAEMWITCPVRTYRRTSTSWFEMRHNKNGESTVHIKRQITTSTWFYSGVQESLNIRKKREGSLDVLCIQMTCLLDRGQVCIHVRTSTLTLITATQNTRKNKFAHLWEHDWTRILVFEIKTFESTSRMTPLKVPTVLSVEPAPIN